MDLLLTRYALERLLHRLSLSPHRERFVLKGAMLLVTWFDEPHRATRDVDLLGFGDATEDALLTTFREIMSIEVDDGVNFDLKNLRIDAIREELEYGGSRLRTTAALAGARIPITVDIGFGDAIAPGAEDVAPAGAARHAFAPPARLSARDRDRRKGPCDGGPGTGQQPHEGLLRRVDADQRVRPRPGAHASGHRSDVRSPQHSDPGSGTRWTQRRVCKRPSEAAAMERVCARPHRICPAAGPSGR